MTLLPLGPWLLLPWVRDCAHCGVSEPQAHLLFETLCSPALLFTTACFQWLMGTDKWLVSCVCGLPNPPGSQHITEALPYLSGSSTHTQGFSLWVNTAAIHYLTQGEKKNKGRVPNVELQLITLMSSLINNPGEFSFYFILPLSVSPVLSCFLFFVIDLNLFLW